MQLWPLGVLIYCAILFARVHTLISVRNGRLVDEAGGERIFHGLNLVSKGFPYITSFNEADMKLFQQLGINGIRLGVMWGGVEPKRGEFNETYLKLMLDTVQKASQYGIFTLVEFHQDLFSQKFCADGVPIWAIPHELSKSFPRPIEFKTYKYDNVTGLPSGQDCSKHPWGQFYISDSVSRSFGSLWKNKFGLRDLFINYWRKVAETFRKSEHVIAYEIINEPWPGDPFEDPLVMVPGLSESIHLQNNYDSISAAIREVDPDHSICFQPVTWLNYFPAGFTHPPGGKKYKDKSIFCYHYYDPPTFNLKLFMQARMADVHRLGTGGLLSEFYVIDAQGEKNIPMMDACDDNLQSWFGWLYDIGSKDKPRHLQSQDRLHEILYDDSGLGKANLIKGITRTFAARVAGETISQKFDTVTLKFTLTYIICASCGPTFIFVSEKHIYKNGIVLGNVGYDISCYPTGQLIWAKPEKYGGHYLQLSGNGINDGQKVMVVITAL